MQKALVKRHIVQLLSKINQVFENGFRHYEQSVRVVEKIEKGGKGLNLTDEVKNGILCHTRGEEAYTLEGQIIKIADKIAYINHDIDDAERFVHNGENHFQKPD